MLKRINTWLQCHVAFRLTYSPAQNGYRKPASKFFRLRNTVSFARHRNNPHLCRDVDDVNFWCFGLFSVWLYNVKISTLSDYREIHCSTACWIGETQVILHLRVECFQFTTLVRKERFNFFNCSVPSASIGNLHHNQQLFKHQQNYHQLLHQQQEPLVPAASSPPDVAANNLANHGKSRHSIKTKLFTFIKLMCFTCSWSLYKWV